MKAKRSTLNLCLCSLFAAATITLSACASNEATQKIASTNAFGPLNLTTQEYQQAFDDASSDTSFKAQVLLTRSQIVSGDLDKATPISLKTSEVFSTLVLGGISKIT